MKIINVIFSSVLSICFTIMFIAYVICGVNDIIFEILVPAILACLFVLTCFSWITVLKGGE
jgi:hypothetical protein